MGMTGRRRGARAWPARHPARASARCPSLGLLNVCPRALQRLVTTRYKPKSWCGRAERRVEGICNSGARR
eukprot:535778-Rhodomonas_salina.1